MFKAIISGFETTVEYAFKQHNTYTNCAYVYVYNQTKPDLIPETELIHHVKDIHGVEVLSTHWEGEEL